MSTFSPCGINCHECEAYIATQNNDLEILKKHQQNLKEQFGKEIPIAELYCDGCMADGRKIGFCTQCAIRICCINKGYENCASCPDFPCSMVHSSGLRILCPKQICCRSANSDLPHPLNSKGKPH
ncbi:MAG: DUF3795 domain-containing protein [Candidatus Cloacimonetes bacterium]|nr:DUF3795 domain-containing protein [Candidatus Cloacimonadota bacterium]